MEQPTYMQCKTIPVYSVQLGQAKGLDAHTLTAVNYDYIPLLEVV